MQVRGRIVEEEDVSQSDLHPCMERHVWVIIFSILILIQVIPRNIRGAVIGYGLLCEGVKYSESGNTKLPLAVEVTFGSPGFALSLARVFGKVHVTAEHTLVVVLCLSCQ